MRSLLSDEVTQTVACSIVASRLDYCNALLYDAPTATINKLQRAQNNLARVVCQCEGRTDAAPLLQSLHWLPVQHRITYIKDGGANTQGPDDIGAVIPQRHAAHSGTSETAPIICHTTTYRPTHSN